MSDITSPRRRPSPKALSIAIGATLAVVAIVVVSIFTGGHVTNDGQSDDALIGKTMRTFSLSGLSGGTVTAPWKSHHAAVLIFFASWCGPCQAEMPKVAKYLRSHNEAPIRVIGIDANDERGAAKSFVKKSGVAFPVAFDPNGNVTNGIFGFQTLPETVFLSAKGVVTDVVLAAIPKNELASGIAALRKVKR